MDYTLGKRERTNFLDDRGRATDGYRQWYKMADGQVDYIEIEKSQYSADKVREMIEAEIAEHEKLAQ